MSVNYTVKKVETSPYIKGAYLVTVEGLNEKVAVTAHPNDTSFESELANRIAQILSAKATANTLLLNVKNGVEITVQEAQENGTKQK